jgi:hypothetical protein
MRIVQSLNRIGETRSSLFPGDFLQKKPCLTKNTLLPRGRNIVAIVFSASNKVCQKLNTRFARFLENLVGI